MGQNRQLRSYLMWLVLALLLVGVVVLAACQRLGSTAAPAPTATTSVALPTATALAQSGAPAIFTSGPTVAATRMLPTATTAAAKPSPTAVPRTTPTPTAGKAPDDGLQTVRLADLPREAQETIRLIDQGGPFPYDRDGVVFSNRERLLPLHPDGYYHEYTVITPGSADRGARRVIAGRAGELYYTDDHYASFRRVVR